MIIATFDIDAQKGFTPLCPTELPVPEGETIVSELNYLATFGSLRIGSKDAHSKNAVWVADTPAEMLKPIDFPNADLTWVRHCEPGTTGFEWLDGLPKPTEYDYFVWKGVELDLHPYGACYHDLQEKMSTGVIEYLRQNKVDLVLVGGLAFDYCVKTTVLQLSRSNFSVIVYLPATRALSKEGFAATREELEQIQNVRIAETREDIATFLAE